MVHDDEPVGPDGVRVVFDDDRVVSDAGIALVATLAERLGIERLVGRFVRLARDRPGAANAGRKVMALIYGMLLGADCIDGCEVLREVVSYQDVFLLCYVRGPEGLLMGLAQELTG